MRTMTDKEKKPGRKSAHTWKERVLVLRSRLDLENRELAERLGVSIDALKNWLYRDITPSPLAQKRIIELENQSK